jgi:CHAT domain-containing protein
MLPLVARVRLVGRAVRVSAVGVAQRQASILREGLLSLSRAFLHAGARAVVATGWMVDDRETACSVPT